ncbi:hypothetical protein MRX96_003727 [Rhipicephalus microplus]
METKQVARKGTAQWGVCGEKFKCKCSGSDRYSYSSQRLYGASAKSEALDLGRRTPLGTSKCLTANNRWTPAARNSPERLNYSCARSSILGPRQLAVKSHP